MPRALQPLPKSLAHQIEQFLEGVADSGHGVVSYKQLCEHLDIDYRDQAERQRVWAAMRNIREQLDEEFELTRSLLLEFGYLKEGEDAGPVCSELRRKWKTGQTEGLEDFLL